ncbi:MAG: hypothetical protein LBC92_01770 [Rickettsiales bacterium]|jgi:adenosylhomocysteine nucleosidase|nr:hypothetical protein [Rickettsiales bacterium]
MKFNPNECLFIIACEEEDPEGIFIKNAPNVVFSGVGKINAAYHLTKKLGEIAAPKYVINVGSVGSKKFKLGDVVYCNKFVQRDMNVKPLGYVNYATPSDVLTNKSKTEYIIEHREVITDLPNAICGTGDSFVEGEDVNNDFDVVDMEGYALARVCKFEKIDFISLKYISDDFSSSKWIADAKETARTMYEYLF